MHTQAPRKHVVVLHPEHHEGIPLGARQERKTLVHIRQSCAGGGDPAAGSL